MGKLMRVSNHNQVNRLTPFNQLYISVPFFWSVYTAAIALLVIIIIIKFIKCNWVVTPWQWLFYVYTKYEIGY